MRFLQIFAKFFFLLLVFSGGGFLLVREGLLYYAAQRIVVDARFLARTNRWQDQSVGCISEATPGVRRLQLRFLDSRHYNLELGCQDFTQVVWYQKELPPFVQKTTGTAGFTYDLSSKQLQGELTLHLWGQDRVIKSDNRNVSTSWGKTFASADSLITSCVAHGFACCDPVAEEGSGELLASGVNDCQQQCFASCRPRPRLLLFQPDPPLDNAQRELVVNSATPTIVFHYVFEENAVPLRGVRIDYGDGTQESFATATGEAVKQYVCEEKECRFTVTIRAEDEQGARSASTHLSTMVVVTQPR